MWWSFIYPNIPSCHNLRQFGYQGRGDLLGNEENRRIQTNELWPGWLVLTNESKKDPQSLRISYINIQKGRESCFVYRKKAREKHLKGKEGTFYSSFLRYPLREKSAILPEKEGVRRNEMLENGLFPKGFQGAWCRRKKMWWKKDLPLDSLESASKRFLSYLIQTVRVVQECPPYVH